MNKKSAPTKAKAKPKRKKVRAGDIIAKIKGKAGRPSYKPTQDECELVAKLSRVGLQQAEISKLVGMSEPTLRKHFAREIAVSHGLAIADALDKGLIQQAIAGNVTAAIFIAKTRAGWREQPTQLEVKNEGGITPDEKQAIIGRILQLMAPKDAPVDVTPPKVIEHE